MSGTTPYTRIQNARVIIRWHWPMRHHVLDRLIIRFHLASAKVAREQSRPPNRCLTGHAPG